MHLFCYKKIRLPTLCGPQNWQTFAFVYFFWYQLLIWNCIFSHLLANVPRRPKVGKRTPTQIWGGLYTPEKIWLYTSEQSLLEHRKCPSILSDIIRNSLMVTRIINQCSTFHSVLWEFITCILIFLKHCLHLGARSLFWNAFLNH